jgi:flagellar hook assembly protein FlgD
MYVYGVPQDAEVKIFSLSGSLVRTYAPGDLNQIGGLGGWDGKTNRGEYAATGVYLLSYVRPDGNSQVLKFAVIRR